MTQQDIINFLNGFNPSGAALTPEQLGTLATQLRGQVNQLSVTVPNSQGATTLLYSGITGDGVHSGAVAQSLADANPGKIVTINQTDVAALLDKENIAFHEALKSALGNDVVAYSHILEGKDASGNRVSTTSLWDDASRRFADAATGDVRTVTSLAGASGVFSQTEVGALLNNPNVTSIDGIPKSHYERMVNDALAQNLTQAEALNRVSATMSQVSLERTATLQFPLDAQGRVAIDASAQLQPLGTTKFFDGTSITGSDLSDATVSTTGGNLIYHAIENGLVSSDAHISQNLSEAKIGIDQLKQYDVLDNGGRLLNKLGIIGDVIALGLVARDANAAYANGDTAGAEQIIKNGLLVYAGGLAGGLLAAELVGTALLPLYAAGPAGAIIAGGLTLLAGIAGGIGGEVVAHQIADLFSAAQRFVPRRDPLTLDLNGNGIETIAPNLANPILFDHEGQGIKTGTGWIAPSDGFLVLDRNGNGTIDDGTELFGDNTPLYDVDGTITGKAADGFDALAQEDTNADGVVNSADANFANLRVWQDLNQDGVSQDGELKTLAELGIESFNVASINHSQLLANGNQIADTGTYTRTDGSTGTAGVTAGMADVNLAVDTFHRTFTDVIPTTVDTATLPDMQGSGVVRDLREAASIQSAEGATLASTLGQFSASTTRNGQRALLDTLITDWAATSGFEDMATKAAAHGYTLTTNLGPEWQHKLTVLETFNGRGFYKMPWDTINAQSGVTGMSVTHDATGDHISINMNGTQLALLDQAYSALKESLYDALLPQTRLKPYLDDIGLTLDDTGIALDFAALDTRLTNAHIVNANTAVGDLLDLRRLMGDTLEASGRDGLALLTDWAATDAGDAAVAATLADFGYGGGIHTGATGTVNGGNANDVVAGQAGDDVLSGGSGNDMLLVGNGNDTLIGGVGNDLLHGGAGNDTYVFNAGDGNDTILETHGDSGIDTLQFGSGVAYQNQLPITAGDISIAQEGDALVFRHINGRDSVTVAHWFNEGSKNKLDTVTFADGRSFDLTTLQLGTINSDVLTALATTPGGIPLNQILAGGAGNDTLTGGEGNDWLLGGTGADTLSGGIGNDTYAVDNAGDIVIENAGEGVDIVEASVSYTLTDNVENLTLVGASGINGTGNALDNLITGNAADNALYGMEGNDTLDDRGAWVDAANDAEFGGRRAG